MEVVSRLKGGLTLVVSSVVCLVQSSVSIIDLMLGLGVMMLDVIYFTGRTSGFPPRRIIGVDYWAELENRGFDVITNGEQKNGER